eukprot:3364150-Pleurochrysis_carterae.AAC.2
MDQAPLEEAQSTIATSALAYNTWSSDAHTLRPATQGPDSSKTKPHSHGALLLRGLRSGGGQRVELELKAVRLLQERHACVLTHRRAPPRPRATSTRRASARLTTGLEQGGKAARLRLRGRAAAAAGWSRRDASALSPARTPLARTLPPAREKRDASRVGDDALQSRWIRNEPSRSRPELARAPPDQALLTRSHHVVGEWLALRTAALLIASRAHESYLPLSALQNMHLVRPPAQLRSQSHAHALHRSCFTGRARRFRLALGRDVTSVPSLNLSLLRALLRLHQLDALLCQLHPELLDFALPRTRRVQCCRHVAPRPLVRLCGLCA